MDRDQITKWLKNQSKNRHWLAEQIPCTYGTLTQWFSKGFPEWAVTSIERVMKLHGAEISGGLEVTLTAKEFEKIEEARKLLGIATRKLFYEEAITAYADQILAREAGKTPPATNITDFTSGLPKAAEATPPYGDPKTGTED